MPAAPGSPRLALPPTAPAVAVRPPRSPAFAKHDPDANFSGLPPLVAAIEAGKVISVRLGDGPATAWVFQPDDVRAPEFRVSTGQTTEVPLQIRGFRGRPLRAANPNAEAGERMFLSVVNRQLAGLWLGTPGDRGSGARQILPTPDGRGFVAVEESAVTCSLDTDTGLARLSGGQPAPLESGVPVAFDIADVDGLNADGLDIAASMGDSPVDGKATRYDRALPLGPRYEESLKTARILYVQQSAGANTAANIELLTARYLSVGAALNALYEHEVGFRLQVQEIVLVVTGSNFAGPALDNTVINFRDWIVANRPIGTHGWTVASKVGSVSGANGLAVVSSAATFNGINLNNALSWGLVGHECGHSFGANHTDGGIMAGSTNSSRTFFTQVQDFTSTAADEIHTYSSQANRLAGTVPLRRPREIPYGADDVVFTTVGQPVAFFPLDNDSPTTPFNGYNGAIALDETGRVEPLAAGTVAINGNQLVFTPTPGWEGAATLTYSIRGNTGNGGLGWLHRADVAVLVGQVSYPAPTVAATLADNTRVRIDWTFAGANPPNWSVERRVNNGPWQPIFVVPGNTRNFWDVAASPGATFDYRVAAHNSLAVAGAYGQSTSLPATATVLAYEDFSDVGGLAPPSGWSLLSAAPESIAFNDPASSPAFVPTRAAGGLRLNFTNPPGQSLRRLALVASGELNLNTLGATTFSATIGNASTTSRDSTKRIVAWLDNSGAMLWFAIQPRRRVLMYSAPGFSQFLAEAGTVPSLTESDGTTPNPEVLFATTNNITGGDYNADRVHLRVTPTQVQVVSYPLLLGPRENSDLGPPPFATVGLNNHQVAGFTGIGRFAVGGYETIPANASRAFLIDDLSVHGGALPSLPPASPVDEYLEVAPGGTVLFRPLDNDVGDHRVVSISGSTQALAYQPTGGNGGDVLGWALRARPNASGTEIINYTVRMDALMGSNDGATATARIHVTYTPRAPTTPTYDLSLDPQDGPFRFDVLARAEGLGYRLPGDVRTSTSTTNSPVVLGNAFRLVSATHNGSGTLTFETDRVFNGSTYDQQPTGKLVYAAAAGESGTITVNYTVRDALGNESTGAVNLVLTGEAKPLVEVSVNLAQSTEAAGEPVSLRVFRPDGLPSAAPILVRLGLVGDARIRPPGDLVLTGIHEINTLDSTFTVRIPAGASEVFATLTPVDDTLGEGLEPVEIVVQPDAAYAVGTAGRAVFGIVDDDTADFGTEVFTASTGTAPMDLLNTKLTFTPVQGAGYRGSIEPAAVFPSSTAGATVLLNNGSGTPPANGTVSQGDWRVLLSQLAVPFFQRTHTELYITTSGYITFGVSDLIGIPSNSTGQFYKEGVPRLAPQWAMTSTSTQGKISYQEITTPGEERLVVTWENLKSAYSAGAPTTVQLEMFLNGKITVTTLSQATRGSVIVGLAKGSAKDANWVSADLSAYPAPPAAMAFSAWMNGHPEFVGDDALPDGDPDGDGVPNLLEFALGGEPGGADSGLLPIFATAVAGGDRHLTLTFTPQRVDGLSYVIQSSNDLVNWTDTELTGLFEGNTHTFIDPVPAAPRRFLRLKVTE